MTCPTNPARGPMNTETRPRPPFDHARLHRLELAAENAYAVTRALSERRAVLRSDRAKLAGSENPASCARYEFVTEQLRIVDAEIVAHHEKSAPLHELAQICVEWARRRSWRGNSNPIGQFDLESPGNPASPPITPRIDSEPLTHHGPPPDSGLSSLVSRLNPFAGGVNRGK